MMISNFERAVVSLLSFGIIGNTFFSFFAWRFILNEKKKKYYDLIDHILSETICILCFCVLFSNVDHRINFMAKTCSDLCNTFSKMIAWNFCLINYFYIFY